MSNHRPAASDHTTTDHHQRSTDNLKQAARRCWHRNHNAAVLQQGHDVSGGSCETTFPMPAGQGWIRRRVVISRYRGQAAGTQLGHRRLSARSVHHGRERLQDH